MINSRTISPAGLVAGLESGQTIVTVTRRLARELHREYQISQAGSGKRAWETPDIIPYEAWLKQLWHQVHFAERAPTLLNDQQTEKIWSNIIEADLERSAPDTAPLWNTQAAAQQAMAAWQLLQQWDIPIELCAQSWLEDHRRFATWATQFSRRCRDGGWLESSEPVSYTHLRAHET